VGPLHPSTIWPGTASQGAIGAASLSGVGHLVPSHSRPVLPVKALSVLPHSPEWAIPSLALPFPMALLVRTLTFDEGTSTLDLMAPTRTRTWPISSLLAAGVEGSCEGERYRSYLRGRISTFLIFRFPCCRRTLLSHSFRFFNTR